MFNNRITVAVFSMLKTTLQIWLNGQPVLTHEYVGENGEINRKDGFYGFRDLRHKHTDGEVTCVSTEQYVSLPANSLIGKSSSEKFFYQIKIYDNMII